MRTILSLTALALTAIAAPAMAADKPAAGEAVLAKALAGATPGKPRSCLSTTLPRPDSQNINGIGVLYKDGRTAWLNRFQGGCPQLDSFSVIVTRTSTSQLCRGDIARIVDQSTGMQRGACAFGDFVPYTLPRK